jgi:hypothetical protein
MGKASCLTFILALISVCLLSACNTTPACQHIEVIDPGVDATCTTDGMTEGKHCSVCGEVLVAQTTIEACGHTEVLVDAVPATCTKWGATGQVQCELCGEVFGQQTFLEPTGHLYVNGTCTVCQKEKTDYSDIGLYASNEGYTFFETLENGDAMRGLYDEMEEVLTQFHTSATTDAPYCTTHQGLGELYTVAEFDYSKYGLGLDEAQTVYTVFRKDHPVFYWMSYWLYWNSETITITTVRDYAEGKDRARYYEACPYGRIMCGASMFQKSRNTVAPSCFFADDVV